MKNLLIAILCFLPICAFADGTITNGATHTGTIEIGGLDTWTFAATKNDSIVISIGEVASNGPDPFFEPWLRLRAPDGSDLGGAARGTNAAQIDVRAPLTGIYTVLVAHYPFNEQTAAAAYILTVARTTGPYTISPNDEGGPMTNAFPHSGAIAPGDLDTWFFQANKNDSLTISVGEVASNGPDPFFEPWLRLRGPDGSDLGGAARGTNAAQIDVRAPLTGIYTVLVAHYPFNEQTGTALYRLTASGVRAVAPSVAAILPVAGSTQGNNAFFRTSVQMHNPRTTPLSGTFVFHRSDASAGANDPSLAYTLSAGQTVTYDDILPAMGVASGLGSIDITTSGDPLPVMAVRIFSDGGENGTSGFFLEPVAPDAALQTGDTGVLLAPADPAKARLNIGIRSLETGASLVIAIRNRNGGIRGSLTKTLPPNFFQQVSANVYLGLLLEGSDTITFSVNSGKAIVYGAQVDNKTQDSSAQYAKKTF